MREAIEERRRGHRPDRGAVRRIALPAERGSAFFTHLALADRRRNLDFLTSLVGEGHGLARQRALSIHAVRRARRARAIQNLEAEVQAEPLRVRGIDGASAGLDAAAGGVVGAGVAFENVAVSAAPVALVTLPALAAGVAAGCDAKSVFLITDVGTGRRNLRQEMEIGAEEAYQRQRPSERPDRGVGSTASTRGVHVFPPLFSRSCVSAEATMMRGRPQRPRFAVPGGGSGCRRRSWLSLPPPRLPARVVGGTPTANAEDRSRKS